MITGRSLHIAVTLLMVATVAVSAALEPAGLAPIGVRRLRRAAPELTGERVRIGVVELSEAPDVAGEPGSTFLPNFGHDALSAARFDGLHYYDNPDRPVRYSTHASMVAGILFGSDQAGYDERLGAFAYHGITR